MRKSDNADASAPFLQVLSGCFQTATLELSSEAVTTSLLRGLLRKDKRNLLAWMLEEGVAGQTQFEIIRSALFHAFFQKLAREGRQLRLRRLGSSGENSVHPSALCRISLLLLLLRSSYAANNL